MPSLKDTKQRIASVKSTQKITRAMKLVSSAKYSRAQQRLVRSRDYSGAVKLAIDDLLGPGLNVPISFAKRSVSGQKKILLLVITSDRGLCGALNTNIARTVGQSVSQWRVQGSAVHVVMWGKKSDFVRRLGVNLLSEETRHKVLEAPSYLSVKQEAKRLADRFLKGEFDEVYVAHSQFQNALTQQAKVSRWLPVDLEHSNQARNYLQPICEPTSREVLSGLIYQKLIYDFYGMILNGAVSEHAARMTAMDSATNNADKVIRDLTLQYNRARQAAITKELIEITSGAEAL